MTARGLFAAIAYAAASCAPISAQAAASIKGAFGIDGDFFSSWLKIVQERRQRWLAEADAAKPALHRREVLPKRIVKPAADSAAFQGWKMVPSVSMDTALNRPLSVGDEFIFDFGEHLVGYLSVKLVGFERAVDAPVRLKFSFAEVPSELAEDSAGTNPSVSSAWYQDEIVTIDDLPVVCSLPRRYAFRYVRMKVVGCSPHGRFGLGGMSVSAVTSADESKLPEWKAPTEKAAKIDEVARRTLRDCMQSVFEDGPKRDRRLWLGDLRLEALANYETYRNFAIVKRSMYLLAGTCGDNGLVNSDAYERPVLRSGDCRILDYTALFAAVVLEYLEASADKETALDLWPLCVRQLDFILDTVGEDGVFRDNGKWWCFIDWQKSLDRQTAEQGAIIYGLKATQRLAEKLGRTDDVSFLPALTARMERGARAVLWDDGKGCFVCEKSRQSSFLGQAWLVLAGVPVRADAQRCLRNVMSDPSAVRPVTPYANHYFTEALYVAGLRKEGDAHLLSYWGKMVDYGADTFWEVFVPDNHHAGPYRTHLMNSYCHAWSCAPSYFLRNARFNALSGE